MQLVLLFIIIIILAGIKFIPLRTTGGELIPESGLFVQISKEEVEEIQPSSLRSAKLRRQAELNDNDDPNKILSTIAENEEDVHLHDVSEALPNDVDVMQSINPIAFKNQQRRPKSPSNARPLSTPPLIESYSTEDKDVAKEETNLNKIVVVVDVNETEPAEDKRVEGENFQIPESHSQTQILNSVTSSSKPRSLTIEANPKSSVHASETSIHSNNITEETDGADMVKEYRLHVKSGEEEK